MFSKMSLAFWALFGLSTAYYNNIPDGEVEATQFAMTVSLFRLLLDAKN